MANSTFDIVLNMTKDDVLNSNTHKNIKNNFKVNGRKSKNEMEQNRNNKTTNSVRNNDVLPFIIPYHLGFSPLKNVSNKN